jgi:hypothetical protein
MIDAMGGRKHSVPDEVENGNPKVFPPSSKVVPAPRVVRVLDPDVREETVEPFVSVADVPGAET